MSSYLSLAPYYDTLFPTPPGLLQWIQSSPHFKILDLGCGTGLLVEALIENQLDAQGLDPDPQMIEYGLKRNSKLPLNCQNSSTLEDQSLDLVCTVGNVCSYWDKEQWNLQIAEINRLLRPGGQ